MADQGDRDITCFWTVPVNEKQIRLDVFARRCVPHLSRRALVDAIRAGTFFLNGRAVKKGARLSGGDELVFRGPESWLAASPLADQKLHVPVVYEDDAVMVLDKPAGMATHGFSGRDEFTLANFLAAQRPQLNKVGNSRWEPGLVHRLDGETSGLVVVAKTAGAHAHLERQFRRRTVTKIYLALVWGNTAARGVIEFPLAHEGRDKRRMAAVLSSARAKDQKTWRAVTRYRRLAAGRGLTLVEIDMETGVTHQIRVHLATVGHPIVGDGLYGDPAAETFGLNRHFLHAWKLQFAHPVHGRMLNLKTDLPDELDAVLNRLEMTFERSLDSSSGSVTAEP